MCCISFNLLILNFGNIANCILEHYHKDMGNTKESSHRHINYNIIS